MIMVDYKTFITLQDNYAEDKDSVYYYNQIVKCADPNTFKVNDMTFISSDKFACYQDGERVDCNKIEDE